MYFNFNKVSWLHSIWKNSKTVTYIIDWGVFFFLVHSTSILKALYHTFFLCHFPRTPWVLNATTTCTMYIHSLVTEKIYQNFNVRHLYIRWVKSLFSTTYIYRTTVEKIYIIKHSIEFNGTIEADLNLNLFIGYASIPIFVVYSFKYYIGVPLQC